MSPAQHVDIHFLPEEYVASQTLVFRPNGLKSAKSLAEANYKELLEFHFQLRKYLPTTGCHTASRILSHYYTNCKMISMYKGACFSSPEFVIWGGTARVVEHSFLLQEDGAIVDATADQFGIKNFGPVMRLYPDNPRYFWYHDRPNSTVKECMCGKKHDFQINHPL